MSTQIPAAWAVHQVAIPTVCTRHGLPEARRVRTSISQRTPGWMYALLILGLVVFFIARAVGRTSITAAAWPFCGKCLSLRRAAIAGLCVAGAAAVASWVVSFVVELPALIFLGFVLAIAAACATPLVTWSWLSGAHLAEHSGWIMVPKAHREFAVQFETLRRQTVAETAQPQPMGAPAPLVKRLTGWWYVLLIAGIIVAVTGGVGFFGEPVCGTEAMVPGDVCVDDRGVEAFTYESEKAGAAKGLWWAIAGVVAAIGAGIRIRQWNRGLRRAWTARQGQPTV